MNKRYVASRTFESGFSLVELMVVVIISLAMSLAVFGILSTSESKKRTTLASSDVDQAGGFAMYILDKQIRSAGTGFRASYAQSYGCLLSAAYNGNQILPTTANLPAEFAALSVTAGSKLFRLAPIVIAKNQAAPYGGNWNGSASGSDFLISMSGSDGFGEVPVTYTSPPTQSPAQLTLVTTLGIKPNDVLLQIDAPVAGVISACMFESVSSTFTGAGTTNVVGLAGKYLTTSVTGKTLGSYTQNGSSLDLGQGPSFALFGVGNNTTLYSYDLLQGNNTGGSNTAISQAVASDVYELKALYGVDLSPTGNGSQFQWVDPGIAPWDISTLMNGSAASDAQLKQITAIRVGLIMRSALPEKLCSTATPDLRTNCALVNQPNPTLFGDIKDVNANSLTYVHALTTAEKPYRFRTVEETIPLRNNLL